MDPNSVYHILSCPNEVNTGWFLKHTKQLLNHYDGYDLQVKLRDAGVRGITTLTPFTEDDPLEFGLDVPKPSQESQKTDWVEDDKKFYIINVSDSETLKNGFIYIR